MTTTVAFPTESPYSGEKIRKIFTQGIDESLMVDEFAAPIVNPVQYRTYYIPEECDNSGALIINPPEDTEALVWPPCSNHDIGAAWSEVPKNLPKSLKVLDLGHDGLIYGNRLNIHEKDREMWEDDTICREILKSLPNLEKVFYCGYYSQIDYDNIAKDFPNISFEAIY